MMKRCMIPLSKYGKFGGGGREKAGGINNLPESDIASFKEEFEKVFS